MSRKTILIYLLLHIMITPALSQERSTIWQLGHVNVSTGYSYYLDFSNSVVDTGILTRKLKFFNTNASICDTNGELLFYTNGVWIANKNHDTLFNSQNFNPGYGTEFYGDDGLGYPQGAIAIPNGDSVSLYNLIYITTEYVSANGTDFTQPLHLSLSEIDMNKDGGLGAISNDRKNIYLIEDTITQGRITACKNANGKDWWIISHQYNSDLYYKTLITSDTFHSFTQSIGNLFKSNDIFGMAVFSSDGSQYAHLNINDTIDLLNFDRCSGEFLSFVELSVPDTGTLSATTGCSFSPNNRFLYVSTYWSLYQFDTWADDIQASIVKVGSWQDQTGWPDWFFLHQLAPDGKIYISLFNGDHWLHVINDPDSLGPSCNFVQGGLILPYVATNTGIPNLPNYDLGPLEGSPCDTFYTSKPQQSVPRISFKLNPNPVSDWFNIVYNTKEDCLLTLYDINGKQVASVSLFHYFKNRLINVSALPAGVYLAVVTCKGERVWSEKVVVQH